MDTTATRMTAEQFFAVSVEGDRKQLVDGVIVPREVLPVHGLLQVRRLARVPELCVEIRSPSTWRYDVGVKKSIYEAAALPELWLVDSEAATVLVFRRSAPESPRFDVALELRRGDTLTSPQLPRFELTLDQLFDD
jgi:Uma2 family endonuclease